MDHIADHMRLTAEIATNDADARRERLISDHEPKMTAALDSCMNDIESVLEKHLPVILSLDKEFDAGCAAIDQGAITPASVLFMALTAESINDEVHRRIASWALKKAAEMETLEPITVSSDGSDGENQ